MTADIPDLTTKHLRLRAFRQDDVEMLVENLLSDRGVTAYLPVQPRTEADQREAARDYIEALTAPWAEHGHGGWAVCLRDVSAGEEPPLIGYCGFFRTDPDDGGPSLPPKPGPELGFGLARAHWRKGYATEAANAALRGLFELGYIDRVFATCAGDNRASRRVLEKIGMTFKGEHDLFNSVAEGLGKMPLFTAERVSYLQSVHDR